MASTATAAATMRASMRTTTTMVVMTFSSTLMSLMRLNSAVLASHYDAHDSTMNMKSLLSFSFSHRRYRNFIMHFTFSAPPSLNHSFFLKIER